MARRELRNTPSVCTLVLVTARPGWTDDWPAPRSHRSGHTVEIVVTVICLALAAGAAIVVTAIRGLQSLGPVERKHLNEISIANGACPYVTVMHVAATNFQNSFPGITNGAALDSDRWPTTRNEVGTTAAVFEHAVFVSIPHFPPRARRYLVETARALYTGQQELAHARGPIDLIS